jgi:hypothetical protein
MTENRQKIARLTPDPLELAARDPVEGAAEHEAPANRQPAAAELHQRRAA